jgi:hypothetical protein
MLLSASESSDSTYSGARRCPNCGGWGPALACCTECGDPELLYSHDKASSPRLYGRLKQVILPIVTRENRVRQWVLKLPRWTKRSSPRLIAEGTRVIILNKDAVEAGGLMGVVTKQMTKMVEVTRLDSNGMLTRSRRYPNTLVQLGDGVTCRQNIRGEWSIMLEDVDEKSKVNTRSDVGYISDDENC